LVRAVHTEGPRVLQVVQTRGQGRRGRRGLTHGPYGSRAVGEWAGRNGRGAGEPGISNRDVGGSRAVREPGRNDVVWLTPFVGRPPGRPTLSRTKEVSHGHVR